MAPQLMPPMFETTVPSPVFVTASVRTAWNVAVTVFDASMETVHDVALMGVQFADQP